MPSRPLHMVIMECGHRKVPKDVPCSPNEIAVMSACLENSGKFMKLPMSSVASSLHSNNTTIIVHVMIRS